MRNVKHRHSLRRVVWVLLPFLVAIAGQAATKNILLVIADDYGI